MRPTILRRPAITPATPPPPRWSLNPVRAFRGWRERTWRRFAKDADLGTEWLDAPAPFTKFVCRTHADWIGYTWQITSPLCPGKVIARGWGKTNLEAYREACHVFDLGHTLWKSFLFADCYGASMLWHVQASASTQNNRHLFYSSKLVTLAIGRKVPTTYVH